MKHLRLIITGYVVALAAIWAVPAQAVPITFTGSSGTRAASVSFDVVGANLVVTLTNTSTFDVLVPVDVLTAVFFDLTGQPVLTKVSAVLGAGSTVFYDPDGQPAGGVVGGEMAYKTGLAGTPGTPDPQQGLSSVGLGLFGPDDRFPGPDLEPPDSPDGLQYGLLSAGDDTATGNGGVTGSGGLIKNSVVFTLTGLPIGFDLATAISNVNFQYGTDLSEPSIPGRQPGGAVPIPSSLALFGLGLAGLAWVRRR